MVNPAVTAALIAASHQQEVEEKIEGRLRKAGATGPTRAIALDSVVKCAPDSACPTMSPSPYSSVTYRRAPRQ